jgi:glycosyltransferase involved in cell wall biosynthesis
VKGEFNYKIQYLFGDTYLDHIFQKKPKPKIYILRKYLTRLFFIIFNIYKYDAIYIEKELFPYLPGWIERFLKGRYVVDYDDAVFHLYDSNSNKLVKLLFKNKIRNIMKNARKVIVGNDYLGDYAKQSCALNIVYRPTVISKDKYTLKNLEQNSLLTVGWIGTALTQEYLVKLVPVLNKLSKLFNFTLVVVGGDYNLFKGVEFKVNYMRWREYTEVEILRKIDLGIMPVPNRSFERGKCGYKLIQYMALGKPVIGSLVGVNSSIIKNGENGFLVSNIDEWEVSLRKLLSDSDLRTQMGRVGRVSFEKEYSLEAYRDHFIHHLF